MITAPTSLPTYLACPSPHRWRRAPHAPPQLLDPDLIPSPWLSRALRGRGCFIFIFLEQIRANGLAGMGRSTTSSMAARVFAEIASFVAAQCPHAPRGIAGHLQERLKAPAAGWTSPSSPALKTETRRRPLGRHACEGDRGQAWCAGDRGSTLTPVPTIAEAQRRAKWRRASWRSCPRFLHCPPVLPVP